MSDEGPDLSCEIRSFAERDIDVWLAEELRINDVFAKWFASHAPATQHLRFPAQRTRIGVMSENGETDVEAIFQSASDTTFGLLVENKIEHSLSADQLNRYFDRGRYGLTYGFWHAFSVLVFAPATKLIKHSSLIGELPTVSFEDAATFLSTTSTDRRTLYRASFLRRAAMEQSIEVDGADAFRVSFWKHIYDMLDQKFPGYFALNPAEFPKTTYIAANCVGAPSYFRVDLKGHMGEVDLAFKNLNAGKLISFLEAHKPESARIVFNKRSIALQINDLPKFFVGDGIDAVESRALKSFEAAHALLNFWKSHQSFFDDHYAATPG